MKIGPTHLPKTAVSPGAKDSDAGRILKRVPRPVWLGALLVLATLAVYWPTFLNGFIWDDDVYVIDNPTLRSLSGLKEIWFNPVATPQYYPLVHTAFWLEYQAWGLHPMGFHVVNVLLHALAAVLLWRLLERLKLPGGWLAAAVFALHPVNAESVAWVTERKNVLSAVFYFSAALYYVRYLGLGTDGPGPRNRERFYWAALAFYVAALLSKTVACSLPAAILLVQWWKKERLQWRDVVPLAPFFIVGLGLGLTTAWLEKTHVGAAGPDWQLSFGERCLIAGRALCFYTGKLFWPHPLTFIYPRWTVDTAAWWQWLYPAAACSVVAALWLARRRLGKGPLVAVLFFAGTLLPALGFINVYPMRFSFVADHFQYLASIGIIALAVGGTVCRLERSGGPGAWAVAPTVLLLMILGILTCLQCQIYQDLDTLWADTLSKNPRCWMAYTNLGRLRVRQDRLPEAEQDYRKAMELKPEEDGIHYNLGNLLAREGRFAEAIDEYRQAIQINPAKADAHNNLGFALNKLHRTEEAIAEYERALFYQPDYVDAYYNLGNALSAEHKMEAAIQAYQSALRLRPDSALIQERLRSLGALPK